MAAPQFQRREMIGREDPVATGDPHTIQVLPDGTIVVQDTGEHTNPRRYEKDNGFTSDVVAVVGPAATPLWAAGLAAVYPVVGRTAGEVSTIYTLVIENATGAPVTGWLEVAGAAITPPYHLNNNETELVPFVAGKTVGDVDVDCNASAAGVIFQMVGTEE